MSEVLAGRADRLAVSLEVVTAFTLVRVEIRIRLQMTPEMAEALGVRELVFEGVTEMPFADQCRLVAVELEDVRDRESVRGESDVVPGMDLVVGDPELEGVATRHERRAGRRADGRAVEAVEHDALGREAIDRR